MISFLAARVLGGLRAHLLLVVSLLCLPGPVIAQQSGTFQEWVVDCGPQPLVCVASQTIFTSDDQLWLATVQIRREDSGDGADVVVRVPAGVHLASGLFVGVRQPLQSATFVRCAMDICIATARLDRDELSAWKRGRKAELRYRPRMDAAPIAFDISLMGITAALRFAEEAES